MGNMMMGMMGMLKQGMGQGKNQKNKQKNKQNTLADDMGKDMMGEGPVKTPDHAPDTKPQAQVAAAAPAEEKKPEELIAGAGWVMVRKPNGRCACIPASQNDDNWPILGRYSHRRNCQDQIAVVCPEQDVQAATPENHKKD